MKYSAGFKFCKFSKFYSNSKMMYRIANAEVGE